MRDSDSSDNCRQGVSPDRARSAGGDRGLRRFRVRRNDRELVDAAFGYANEQRLLGSNLSTGTFGTGALYTLKMSQNADLTEDAHVLFSLSQGSDWRFVNSVAVTAKVASVFSLKVANMVRYL